MKIKYKEYNLKNIYYFIQGYIRYYFYYNGYKYLINSHILNQIDWRIFIMDTECYKKGSCKICGCDTTALQMSNKSCGKPCYPPMMSESQWFRFNLYLPVKIKNDIYLYRIERAISDKKTIYTHRIYKNNKMCHFKITENKKFYDKILTNN